MGRLCDDFHVDWFLPGVKAMAFGHVIKSKLINRRLTTPGSQLIKSNCLQIGILFNSFFQMRRFPFAHCHLAIKPVMLNGNTASSTVSRSCLQVKVKIWHFPKGCRRPRKSLEGKGKALGTGSGSRSVWWAYLVVAWRFALRKRVGALPLTASGGGRRAAMSVGIYIYKML